MLRHNVDWKLFVRRNIESLLKLQRQFTTVNSLQLGFYISNAALSEKGKELVYVVNFVFLVTQSAEVQPLLMGLAIITLASPGTIFLPLLPCAPTNVRRVDKT